METVEFFFKKYRLAILTSFLNLKVKNFVIMVQNWLSFFQQHYEVSTISKMMNFDGARRIWSEHNIKPIRDAFEIWNIYEMNLFQLTSINGIEIILLKPRWYRIKLRMLGLILITIFSSWFHYLFVLTSVKFS